jgi:hypothetical protein
MQGSDDAWVVSTGAVLLVLAQSVYAFYLRAIILRLKSSRHVLWLRMGCPTWWSLAITRGSGAFENPGANRVNLTRWLSDKQYLELDDSVLAEFAKRQLIALRLGIAIGVIVIGYGLLRYFLTV